jgi:uncharacterized integral membrane protein
MKLIQRFLALICLVLLFIFCISNTDPMIVRFLSWESTGLPAFLLLIFAFLTGMMLALIWQSLRSVSGKSTRQERSDRKFGRKKKDAIQKADTLVESTEVEPESTQPESVTVMTEGEK